MRGNPTQKTMIVTFIVNISAKDGVTDTVFCLVFSHIVYKNPMMMVSKNI